MVGRIQGRAFSTNATEGQSRRMYSSDHTATQHRREPEAQEPLRPPPATATTTTTNATGMAAAAAVIVDDVTEHMEGLDMGNHDAH